jgi:predicted nucleotidyltransferase
LLASLESLFARPVDLVMARAIRNRYFLEAIEPTRTLLYAA